MGKMKTFTHPFQHTDQQKTKATKIKMMKEIEEDEQRFLREEIAEYSTTVPSQVKVS